MARVIDAHHHFWRYGAQEQAWRDDRHSAIAHDYGPEELSDSLRAAGVDATVLMQSVDEPAENDRLASYAQSAPFVAGVVGWLPLSDPVAARRERERLNVPALCGVRCLIARDPLEWLTRPDSLSFFRDVADAGLAWDVVPITAVQIEAVRHLAEQVPHLRVVVDHLGRPPLDTGGWEPWAANLRDLSECPSVALKVSVGIDALSSWESWRAPDLDRYIEWAAECFGASRLMIASNWPVVLLRATYEQAWADLSAAVKRVFPDPVDYDMVAGGAAEDWYQLETKQTQEP